MRYSFSKWRALAPQSRAGGSAPSSSPPLPAASTAKSAPPPRQRHNAGWRSRQIGSYVPHNRRYAQSLRWWAARCGESAAKIRRRRRLAAGVDEGAVGRTSGGETISARSCAPPCWTAPADRCALCVSRTPPAKLRNGGVAPASAAACRGAAPRISAASA